MAWAHWWSNLQTGKIRFSCALHWHYFFLHWLALFVTLTFKALLGRMREACLLIFFKISCVTFQKDPWYCVTAGWNFNFYSDIDQKVDFQEFLNFTEPIITKWVDIFSILRKVVKYFPEASLPLTEMKTDVFQKPRQPFLWKISAFPRQWGEHGIFLLLNLK